MEINEKIKTLINDNDVCLFMKGTPEEPQCGFSMAVANVLKHLKVKDKDSPTVEQLVENEIIRKSSRFAVFLVFSCYKFNLN